MIPKQEIDVNGMNGNFLCGVVEGFYGRPWTMTQRKKLFSRMQKMGLNTYLYAPKDDCKHRMFWRDLYSVEEADHLTTLIQCASEYGVTFVYAISPGIDIAYSSTKDCTLLKRKLEQVSSFGCHSFALLFDDIEADMCEADKAIFQSFAHAQVSVTNEVYQHLGEPKFLFCPTEYCGTRAVPTVSTSEYLITLGSKLLPAIDIMWTGPKVVSKDITVQSLQELSSVLKRTPVIWDNIHANDYDRKRLFLGPYSGRSTNIIPHVRGVLTNPNCEFEANFIAMHTLARWAKSSLDHTPSHIPDGPLAAEIALEQETEDGVEDELNHGNYHPRQALAAALSDWFDEILSDSKPQVKKVIASVLSVMPPMPAGPATIPIVPTCCASTMPTSAPCINISNLNELNNVELNDSYAQPAMSSIPLNSLVDSSSESGEEDAPTVEPMDTLITPGSSPPSSSSIPEHPPVMASPLDNILTPVLCSKCDTLDVMPMDVNGFSRCSSCSQMQTESDMPTTADTNCSITNEDLILLVDFFHLPFQHGSHGERLLGEVHWLKTNAHLICDTLSKKATAEQLEAAREWRARADLLYSSISSYSLLMDHFCAVPNQALVYDIFPYLWDMRIILTVLRCYIDWLGSNPWYSKAFSSGDQEPWVFQGGLQAEIQRLLPLDNVSDLMLPIVPPIPTSSILNCRPYDAKDEIGVRAVCLKTSEDGEDGSIPFLGFVELPFDSSVGAYVTISPEYCFVIEEADHEVCGYVASALDAQDFARRTEVAWQPLVKEKYSVETFCDIETQSPVKDLVENLHKPQIVLPVHMHAQFPSSIQLSALKSTLEADPGCLHRALACTLAALKSNGSRGVHICLPHTATNTVALFRKLGFCDIVNLESVPESTIVLARAI